MAKHEVAEKAMLFFFYGTLIAGSANPVARSVHRRLRPLGAATARGHLHAIADTQGWYPALVAGDGVVHGQLYASGPEFSTTDLAALDAFENCDPARPDESDYWRESIVVRDADSRPHHAQAYRWGRALPDGACRIADGDFGGWLAAGGRVAWRG